MTTDPFEFGQVVRLIRIIVCYYVITVVALIFTFVHLINMCITLIRIYSSVTVRSINSTMAVRQSSDMAKFHESLKSAKEVVILSGAGISAESGIPTFRGPGGFWRKYHAQSLATPGAFKISPSLVWEFYHYRREVAAKAEPNPVVLFTYFSTYLYR